MLCAEANQPPLSGFVKSMTTEKRRLIRFRVEALVIPGRNQMEARASRLRAAEGGVRFKRGAQAVSRIGASERPNLITKSLRAFKARVARPIAVALPCAHAFEHGRGRAKTFSVKPLRASGTAHDGASCRAVALSQKACQEIHLRHRQNTPAACRLSLLN